MSEQTLFSNDNLRIDFFSDPKNTDIAFVFSPYMNKNLVGNNFGGSVFLRSGFDVVAFKINDDSWYQNIELHVFEKIRTFLVKYNYIRRVAYGISMGGYAAILFSKLLNINQAFVISPQFAIDEQYDTRWKEQADRITWRYRISPESVSEDCFFYCLYDRRNLDAEQVVRLAEVIKSDKLITASIDYAGHSLPFYLADVDLLKTIMVDIFLEGDFKKYKFKKNKFISRNYIESLCSYLIVRKRFSVVVNILNRLTVMFGDNYRIQQRKSYLLEQMGLLDESIECIVLATKLNPLDAQLYAYEYYLRKKKRQFVDALRAINNALSIDPNNEKYMMYRDEIIKMV